MIIKNLFVISIIDINECLTSNGGCHATLATCTNTVGSRTCTCKTGYSGDGITCNGTIFLQFIFFKNTNNNNNKKKKTNSEIDVNECQGEGSGNNCASGTATCTNTVGSFSCSCNTGYSGNGVTCNGNEIFFLH